MSQNLINTGDSRNNNDHEGGGYPIGVVSRLTGIAAGTLRMWERRYAVAEPSRGEKQNRLYARSDVERLILMKRLVDRGHAPSKMAKLSSTEMEKLLDSVKGLGVRTKNSRRSAVVVVGERFSVKDKRDELNSEFLEAVQVYNRMQDVIMDEVPTCDVLLLEISTLQMETSDAVRQLVSTCKARGAVVLYRIASKKSLSLLDSQGVKCLREPASLEEISRACVESAEGGIPGDPNGAPRDLSRLFSYEQLHQIAAMSPAIKCECPNHLADLISSLNAFQKYSEECMEDGDTKDREIHADLRDSSAQARVILEHALERLLKVENIVLS